MTSNTKRAGAVETAKSKTLDFWEFSAVGNDLHSLNDFVRFGISQLRRANVDFRNGPGSAEAEIYFILSEVLSMDLEELEQYSDSRLTTQEKDLAHKLLKERCLQRRPVPYVLGATYYCGHRLEIDERALIPRSVIGTMLDDYFEIYDPNESWKILDLGTGAGGIAIAFALAFPNAQITATDIDAAALEVTRHNVELYGLHDRIKVVESDMFEALSGETYDWILCNPPYVSEDFKQVMAAEYAFEPEVALFGGEQGINIIDRLIREAGNYLRGPGLLAFECGDITSEVVKQKYKGLSGEWYCHPATGLPVALCTTKASLDQFSAN